ncbi:hypothetical protein DFH09DRAFT_1312225 [Mycena vulgaris]|nr:hypothetical protein DFH09DRAFT_1312225 [Mycena vulgaris]
MQAASSVTSTTLTRKLQLSAIHVSCAAPTELALLLKILPPQGKAKRPFVTKSKRAEQELSKDIFPPYVLEHDERLLVQVDQHRTVQRNKNLLEKEFRSDALLQFCSGQDTSAVYKIYSDNDITIKAELATIESEDFASDQPEHPVTSNLCLVLGILEQAGKVVEACPFIEPIGAILSEFVKAYKEVKDNKGKRDDLVQKVAGLCRDMGEAVLLLNDNGRADQISRLSSALKEYRGSTIINHLLFKDAGNNTAVAYFYFDFAKPDESTMEMALRRLVLQLSSQCPIAHGTLSNEHNVSFRKGLTVPDWNQLLVLLEDLLKELGHTYIVIDALDECKSKDYTRFLPIFADTHGLVKYPSPYSGHKSTIRPKKTTSDDIKMFVSSALAEMDAWKSEAEAIIIAKSAGMFRLADCLLQELEMCDKPAELQATLNALPNVEKLLHWIAYAATRRCLWAALEDTIAFDFSNKVQYVFDSRLRPAPEPSSMQLGPSAMIAL